MINQRVAAALRRVVTRGPRTQQDISVKADSPRAARPSLPTRDLELEQLTAEARYHRERYDLYTARMYGLRASSSTRLRELQRAAEGADARLAAARAARAHPASDTTDVPDASSRPPDPR